MNYFLPTKGSTVMIVWRKLSQGRLGDPKILTNSSFGLSYKKISKIDVFKDEEILVASSVVETALGKRSLILILKVSEDKDISLVDTYDIDLNFGTEIVQFKLVHSDRKSVIVASDMSLGLLSINPSNFKIIFEKRYTVPLYGKSSLEVINPN